MNITKSSPILLTLTGDVMLGRLVDQLFPTHNNDSENEIHVKSMLNFFPKILNSLKKEKYCYPWGNTISLFHESNINIINLETSVTTCNKRNEYSTFHFRMHPDNLQILKEAHISYCSLANNHALDYTEEGLIDTISHMSNAAIPYAGIGKNSEEASKPAILQKLGKKFAIFSYSDHFSHWAATSNSPGINYIDVEHYKDKDINQIKNQIEKYIQFSNNNNNNNKQEVDLIIFSIHWGSNYCWKPSEKFQEFAHRIIDECNVGLVHGHSPHHPQGIEIYKGVPIIYGCGDFVDDYAVDDVYRNNLGFMYRLWWDPHTHKFNQLELVPIKIKLFAVSTTMKDNERDWLFQKMIDLSSEYHTSFIKQKISSSSSLSSSINLQSLVIQF